MVDHETCTVHDPDLIAVNGHEPYIFRNLTRRYHAGKCSCGWTGPSRASQWAHLITRDWRDHAGDIATDSAPVHGQPGQNCRCWACETADRAAAGDSLAQASMDADR